jgi:hypothetical protein
MAGRTPLEQGDQFIRSSEPADNGFGQNGYQGASSVKPGSKSVSSNFLPELRAKTFENVQKRQVSSEQYPATYGHRAVNADPVRLGAPVRPVKKPAAK